MKKNLIFIIFLLASVQHTFSQNKNSSEPREHLLMDFGWRFAFGHPYNTEKDFNNGTGYFSYFVKAGYGDGAAAINFDDRSWRKLDLPHDWAVEQPFDSKGSFSHGFKAIGRNFPDASVGWYRKSFPMPSADLGKRMSIAFDGVFRNNIVWVNGHYLGTELSGYLGFEYDITDYLNYGGENEIAIRVDATMEEGWFYEGAGIYRHVWLNKTNPLHVITNGTNVSTKVINNVAEINTAVTINNHKNIADTFDLEQKIIDANGNTVATSIQKNILLKPFETNDFTAAVNLQQPNLWDIEKPYLYKLETTLLKDKIIVDNYVTNFGIRTIRFDANEGFFLNGKHVEIKGTDNHQDHAGVGTAMPDKLQEFRIATLKSLGTNAYRCSHNPPTPELLDACDKMGMLVIDESRLMGINDYHLNDGIKRMINRDRNHPCIIAATPLLKNHLWDFINMDPGVIQIITPAPQWKRKLFNGLAQVIIQATAEDGEIIITATSDNLKTGTIKIKSIKADARPFVAE